MKPEKYDMKKLDDTRRWFREMGGYLQTDNFLLQGTDKQGRKHAMEGFNQLKKELCDEDEK
jgi:hypothetical protein